MNFPRFRRPVCVLSVAVLACLAVSRNAEAGQLDLTVFVGRAYPVYDEHLTIRPSVPSLPGVQVDVSGDPALRTDGGLVFGGALALELGVLAIEGRVDSTQIGFDFSGARYDLRATQAPFAGLTGRVTLDTGRFDAKRFHLLSGNVRIRTPGPIGIVVSGGVSVLPDVTITGSVPVGVEIAGLPVVPGVAPRLQLQLAPCAAEHRFGVNGGAGLRLGGGRLALVAEVRAFYFREYELRFGVEGAPSLVDTLLEEVDPVRFRPVIVNGQAGLVIRF
jgi:hypothetical protein